MRRVILLALAALAGAKPGPETALSLVQLDTIFAVKIVDGGLCCPPAFDLELTADMPEGTTLAVDRVDGPDPTGRRIVEITATRTGTASGLSPVKARVPLGVLRKGVHLVDIHMRHGNAAYERVQAVVVKGRGSDR